MSSPLTDGVTVEPPETLGVDEPGYELTALEEELRDVGAPLAQRLIYRLRWSVQPCEEQLAAALAEIEQAAPELREEFEDFIQFQQGCIEGAPGSIEAAWRGVLGEKPLPEDVKAFAARLLAVGGAQGIPGVVLMWIFDPRHAIAVALGEDDPRAQLFLDAAAATHASGEPVYEFRGRTGTQREMLRYEERRRLRGQRRPVTRDRCRRARAPRARRTTRGPPEDDEGRARPEDDPPPDVGATPAEGCP